ncbi:iron-containing alcohol dehydrogenase [Candidatus Poribacteria bacterium]|nr:iron-containing alcohol dehydrogenase [Candidatus Poribacteria bacterium]
MDSLSNFNVFMPTKILFGIDRVSEIADVVFDHGERAMIVTYEDLTGLEKTVERIEALLEEGGIAVTKYTKIKPDPGVEIINKGAELANEDGCQVMIGVGGGSAIDAAKAIGVVAVNGGDAWDYAVCNPDVKKYDTSLPTIAIPTTSGTGSEVTPVAVITNQKIKSKGAMSNPVNIPKTAIVDPELMRTMPPGLTASTGADALGHAMEAYISVKATPFVEPLSLEAIKLIWNNLPIAYREGSNMMARANMAWASTISGMMLVQSGATGNHSLAQALGAHLHIPHGVGVAIGTPVFLEYAKIEAADKYMRIAQKLGMETNVDGFIDNVRQFLKDLGLPTDLKDKADKVDMRALVENAMFNAPAALVNTPREVTHRDMDRIISELF